MQKTVTTVTVDDFIKTATEKQKAVLFELSDLAEQEKNLVDAYNKKVAPHIADASNASELIDGQGAQSIREDAGFYAHLATLDEQGKLKEVRAKMKSLLVSTVNDYGMANLGIVQRQYQNYVGKPLPKKKAHYSRA